MSTYDPTRLAPRAITAENMGGVPGDNTGLINVKIAYDNGDPTARLISAYFLGPNPPATQNLEPVVVAGDTTVPIGGWVETVQLRHMWGTLPGDGQDIVWGPFGNTISITAGATADKPGKSQEKGNPNKP